jgi:hypothetical protein
MNMCARFKLMLLPSVSSCVMLLYEGTSTVMLLYACRNYRRYSYLVMYVMYIIPGSNVVCTGQVKVINEC